MKIINVFASLINDFREWLFLKNIRSSFKH